MKYFFLFFLFLFYSKVYPHTPTTNEIEYIENKGQWDSNILFKADIESGALFIEKDRLTFVFRESLNRHSKDFVMPKYQKYHSYSIFFNNNIEKTKIQGFGTNINYFNYFIGSDSTKWKGNCKSYKKIIFKDIYENIDLVLGSENGNFKYSYNLSKGANISDIEMSYIGIDKLNIDNQGNLLIHNSIGVGIDKNPISYIYQNKTKEKIPVNFDLEKNKITFKIDYDYDYSNFDSIEIDPSLIFSSYSGSFADNFGATATYDYQGNLYGSGIVFGIGYPTTIGAYDVSFNGIGNTNKADISISKFNSSGTQLIYSTYLGGTQEDAPHSLIVDANNRLIILSTTTSSNFPTTTNAYDKTFNGGSTLFGNLALAGLGLTYINGSDITITKFNAAGNALIGSTYFGGSGNDGLGSSTTGFTVNYGDAIRGEVIVDSMDNIYVSSITNSLNIPTLPNSYKKTNSGGFDGIIAKFNTNLSALIGSTYIGGSGNDCVYDIVFDKQNNILGTGGTTSNNLPVTTGVFDNTYNGNVDGMVVSFDNNLSNLNFCGYIGTNNYDQPYFIEVNSNNQINILGQTTHTSTNYFNQNALYTNGKLGQFISIFDSTYKTMIRSTTFGTNNANPDMSPTAFLVDYCDKIFITGWGANLGTFNTFSLNVLGMPITSNAHQSTTTGNGFYLMILEGDLSKLHYGSYYSGLGPNAEDHVDGGTSRFDKNGIVYHAVCAGCGGKQSFPIFPNNVVGPTNNSTNCNLGVFKFDFGLPVTADFTSVSNCAPGNITFNNISHVIDQNAVTYKWIFHDGTISTLSNPTKFYTTPGEYPVTLIVTDTTSCNKVDTIIKNVLALGYQSTTLPTKYVCKGNSTRIGLSNNSDPNLSIVWNPQNTIDDPNIFSPYASPITTTLYTAIITKNACFDTLFQTVNVDTPKIIDILGPSNICINTNNTYTATKFDSSSYVWSNTNLISANKDTSIYNANSNFNISLVFTSKNGCISFANKNVNISTPTLSINSDTIFCKNNFAKVALNYNLQNPNFTYSPILNFIKNQNDTASFNIDKSMWIKITIDKGINCSVSDSIYVHLLSDLFECNYNNLLCENENVVASVVSPNLYNIIWSPLSKLITPQGSTPASFNFQNNDDKFFVSVNLKKDSTCTFNDSFSFKYLKNNISLQADQTRCRDSGVIIENITHIKDVTYTWTPSSDTISVDSFSANFKTTISKYYFLEIKNQNGCIYKDSIFINVVEDFFNAWGDTIVCKMDTASLFSTPSPNYTWTPSQNFITSNFIQNPKIIVDTTFYVYLTVLDTNSCLLKDSVYLQTFNDSQYIKANFNYSLTCLGDSVELRNMTVSSSFSTKYLWTFNDGTTSTLSNPKHLFTSTNNNVKLKVTDTTKCNIEDSITINVINLNNTKTFLPDIYECKNDTIQINKNSSFIDSPYTITWSPNYNLINPNSFSPSIIIDKDTSYFGYINKFGCIDTLIQKVFAGVPSNIEIFGDSIVCNIDQKTFTATKYIDGQYLWQPTTNIINLNRDSVQFLIDYTLNFISVNYINKYNCSSFDTLNLTKLNAKLTIKSDTIFCKDDTLNVSYKFEPSGGNFTYNNNSNLLTINDSIISFKVDTSRIIDLEYSINNICKTKKSLSYMIFNDFLNPKIDTLICDDNIVKAKSNFSSNIVNNWQPNQYLISPQGLDSAIFNFDGIEKAIILNSTFKNKCTFTDTLYFDYYKNLIQLQADKYVCKNIIREIKTKNIKNSTYDWYPKNIIQKITDSSIFVSIEKSTNVSLIFTSSDGCIIKDSIELLVLDDLAKINGDTLVCKDSIVNLNTVNIDGLKYSWTPFNVILTQNDSSSVQALINKSTKIYLEIENTDGCKVNDSILINSFDDNYFNIIEYIDFICKKDTLTLSTLNSKQINYKWTPKKFILGSDTSNIIKALFDTTQTFKVIASLKGHNCKVEDSIKIFVDTNYLEIKSVGVICKGDTQTVIANFNEKFEYVWSQGYDFAKDTIAKYILNDSMLVYCNATLVDNKCKYIDSLTLDFSRLVYNTVALANPDTIYYGDTAQLYTINSIAISYLWSPDSFLDKTFIPKPKANPPKSFTYIVDVKDRFGCRASDSVDIVVKFEDCKEPEVFLPNAFTPNNDNHNDKLFLRGDNIVKMYLAIYDRWGQKLFESNSQKYGWDGTYNGNKLEPGVFAYYYEVECIGGETYKNKGNVTILK